MAAHFIMRSTAIVFFAVAVMAKANVSATCRFIPGDDEWPARSDWARLNQTVGGRLIASVPQGHVCHDPTYDEAACDALTTPTDWPGVVPD